MESIISKINKRDLKDYDLIYIKENINYLFYFCCQYGHLETAKWLYNLSKMDNNRKIKIHPNMVI